MKSIKISVAAAVYNEEENITDFIESAKLVADEIVVVDGSSLDKTREIAQSLNARVITTSNKKMFNINKNLAISHCKGDWILLLDADERLTKELSNELKEISLKNNQTNGFYLNRKNWFLGGYLTKGGAYPDRVIRFFKKNKGKLEEKSVHEQIKIEGELGYLKNDLIHFADPTFERYLKRTLRYTDETARSLKEENPGKTIFQVVYYMIIKPLLTFFLLYIRHKGYKDGFRGFVWSAFSSAHYFYSYVKYWHEEKQ